jgi:hypothetical protein
VLYEGKYNFAGSKYVDFDTGWESLDGLKVYPEARNRLSLLRVCRQLYCDAALLPFSLNTFVFRSRSIRELAKESLTPLRAGAIASVRLYLGTSKVGLVFSKPGRVWEDLCITIEDSYLPFRAMLPGLRNISISIHRPRAGDYMSLAYGYIGSDYTNDDVIRWIECLERCLREGNGPNVVVVVDQGGEDLSKHSGIV